MENTLFSFFHFAPAGLDARAPNDTIGLTSVDQGHKRAGLEASDLRIRHLRAQHPEQS
jgi:hypothetical protein